MVYICELLEFVYCSEICWRGKSQPQVRYWCSKIWDAHQSGLVAMDSVNLASVYRTSVYSLLKCIEFSYVRCVAEVIALLQFGFDC